MIWQVHIQVTCSAMGGQFEETPGGWCEPTVEFATLGGVLAYLKLLEQMDDEWMVEDYADVVRQEGRAIRRVLKGRSGKDLKQVTADVDRALKKVREPWGVE